MRVCLSLVVYLMIVTAACAQWRPYIGTGIGVDKSHNTLKTNYKSTVGASNLLLNIGATGMHESVFAGAKKICSSFFWGGELFTSFYQLKKTKRENRFFDDNGDLIVLDFKLQEKYSSGAGIFIGKTLAEGWDIFLKGDLFWSCYTLTYIHPEEDKSGKQKQWLFGYAPGLGIQKKLPNSFAIRFDYAYRILDTFKSKNISQETLVPQTTITGKVTPRAHRFTLSLVYEL
jgi:opacity protein-like surface antigen